MYILLWNINMKIWPTITPIYDNSFFNMLSQQQHINMFYGMVYGNTHIA